MCPTYNLVTQVSFRPELNWTNALQNRHWTPSHVSKRVSLFIWICTLPIPLQWLNDSWIFCLKASCLNMRNQRSGCCSSRFLTTTRPWARSRENRSFHNSISRNNIRRELIHVLERKRMAVLSFGACAVVVAATAWWMCLSRRTALFTYVGNA